MKQKRETNPAGHHERATGSSTSRRLKASRRLKSVLVLITIIGVSVAGLLGLQYSYSTSFTPAIIAVVSDAKAGILFIAYERGIERVHVTNNQSAQFHAGQLFAGFRRSDSITSLAISVRQGVIAIGSTNGMVVINTTRMTLVSSSVLFPGEIVRQIMLSDASADAMVRISTDPGSSQENDLTEIHWSGGYNSSPEFRKFQGVGKLVGGITSNLFNRSWLLLRTSVSLEVAKLVEWWPGDHRLGGEIRLTVPSDMSNLAELGSIQLCGIWNGSIYVAHNVLWKVQTATSQVDSETITYDRMDQSCAMAGRHIVMFAPSLTVKDAMTLNSTEAGNIGASQFAAFDEKSIVISHLYGVSVFDVVQMRSIVGFPSHASQFRCTGWFFQSGCL